MRAARDPRGYSTTVMRLDTVRQNRAPSIERRTSRRSPRRAAAHAALAQARRAGAGGRGARAARQRPLPLRAARDRDRDDRGGGGGAARAAPARPPRGGRALPARAQSLSPRPPPP